MGTMVDKMEAHREHEKLYGAVETPLKKCPSINSYLDRVGAEFTGLTRAAVCEEVNGYVNEIASISFGKNTGEVKARYEYLPDKDEAKAIKIELLKAKLPNSIPFPKSRHLPKEVSKELKKPGRALQQFKDRLGRTLMSLIRVDRSDGTKYFLPFTYWSDSKTRRQEPDGKLPLWGMEKVIPGCTVFIHEGANGAEYWESKKKNSRPKTVGGNQLDHPFGEFFQKSVHIGWHGGAPNPERSDWPSLRKAGVKEIVIIPDNDEVGKRAVATISKLAGLPATILQTTSEFPVGFDFADDIPDKFFKGSGNDRAYCGPSFQKMLHPATWVTKSARTTGALRPTAAFLDDWIYVHKAEVFVHRRLPGYCGSGWKKSEFNTYNKRYSDRADAAELFFASRNQEVLRLAYRPGSPSGVISSAVSSSFNIYTPTNIEPKTGDISPFLDFMKQLIPNDKDRTATLAWIATLLGRPVVRMGYALLLISENQGTGKSTLTEHILSPLVGMQNTSFPSESELTSEFNSWVGFKRLVVVAELYQGEGWKTYNRLKSIITDRTISLNEKHKAVVQLENWVHLAASSNSFRALRIDQADRRWLAPKITETKWGKNNFTNFYFWLSTVGLPIILHWAQNHGDYISVGEIAPMTSSKQALIDESRSDYVREAIDRTTELLNSTKPHVVAVINLVAMVKAEMGGHCFDNPRDFRRALVEQGWIVFAGRVSVMGKNDYLLMNKVAADMVVQLTESAAKEFVRETAQSTHSKELNTSF